METNPYEYDRTVSWMPQQNQVYAGRETNQYGQQRPPVRQAPGQRLEGAAQKPKPLKSMPKARTLALAHSLKQGLVVASLVGFGTLSGLAAFHQVGTTASTSATKQTTATSSQKTSTSSSNSFLKQQGKNNVGSSKANTSSSSSKSSSSTSSSSTNNSTSGTSSSTNSSSTNNSSSGTSSSSTSSQPVTGTSTS